MKKKLLIVVVVVITLVLTIVSIRSHKTKIRDFKSILASGRISVVTDNSSLGFRVENDSVYGFQYEIMKAFADKYELELQLTQQNDFEESMLAVQDGDFDIYANFIPTYANMSKTVLLSSPLIKSRLILVQRIDSLNPSIVEKQFELAGDTIFMAENSPYKTRIRNLSNEIADTIYIEEIKAVNIETLVQMVSESKLKNTICLECEAKNLKKKYSNIDISLAVGFNQYQAWAMNKKSKELAEKLDSFLDEYVESSEYWSLYSKYFN